MMKRIWVLSLVALWLLTGVVLSLLLILPRLLRVISLRRLLNIAAWWHRCMLRIFNVRVSVKGNINDLSTVIVSNHISWLDILVIGGQIPTCFVSKAEVRRWPVIGFLAAFAGTLFIKRGSGDSHLIAQQMLLRMQQKIAVLFFPEGTTTDGASLKRFFPRLFAPAIDSNLPISCLTLVYRHQQVPHPAVPYVGDQSLLENVLVLIDFKEPIEVELHIHEAFNTTGLDRKHTAELAEQKIASSLPQTIEN